MRMHKRYGRVVMPTSGDKVVWHCFLAADAFAWPCCRCHGIWNAKTYLGFINKFLCYDKIKLFLGAHTQALWSCGYADLGRRGCLALFFEKSSFASEML